MADRHNNDFCDDYDPWETYKNRTAAPQKSTPQAAPPQRSAPVSGEDAPSPKEQTRPDSRDFDFAPRRERAPGPEPQEEQDLEFAPRMEHPPEDEPREDQSPEDESQEDQPPEDEPQEDQFPEDESEEDQSWQHERKLRRGRRRWRVFILVYTLLFLAAGAAGCYVLYRYTMAYEASLPEHVMDDFMASTTGEQWYDYVHDGADFTVSEFEDGEALYLSYYDAAIAGKKLSYWKDLEHYSDQAPVYKVRGGGLDLCLVYLSPIGQDAAGFGRQLWQLDHVQSLLSVRGLESVTVEIDAPREAEVYLNGKAVGDAYIAEEIPAADLSDLESRFTQPPTYVRYRVDAMYGEITVTDGQGRVLDPEAEEDGLVRYVLHETKNYAVTVRAPSTVTVSINGADLSADEASKSEDGILAGLEEYTGGAGYRTLTYDVEGLRQPPEITARGPEGQELTPLIDQNGRFIFFPPQDDALAADAAGWAQEFFDRYINYSSHAFSYDRQSTLLNRILRGTQLYDYVQDSRAAMIWASATEVNYDELTFADFAPVGENCFTCTIRYKADFEAQSWYQHYSYDMQNAYELAFVRSGDAWYAAAMSVVAG